MEKNEIFETAKK